MCVRIRNKWVWSVNHQINYLRSKFCPHFNTFASLISSLGMKTSQSWNGNAVNSPKRIISFEHFCITYFKLEMKTSQSWNENAVNSLKRIKTAPDWVVLPTRYPGAPMTISSFPSPSRSPAVMDLFNVPYCNNEHLAFSLCLSVFLSISVHIYCKYEHLLFYLHHPFLLWLMTYKQETIQFSLFSPTTSSLHELFAVIKPN